MKKTIFFTIAIAFALAAYAATPSALLKKAQGGDAAAQNTVGGWCYNGTNGMKRNYEEALQWWAKSAKQGNAEAIGNMGMCYRYGHGIGRDSLKATQLYLKSMRSGNDSLLVATEQAAQRGELFDGIVTALAYRSGSGVKRDGEKTKQYLQMAAEGGSADAQREFALICLNTGHQEDAAEWFEKAAKQGDLSSTYFSGMMRMKGMGVAVDEVAGFELIKNAAERDFPQACYDLSQRYAAGDGVEADSAKSVDYLRRAAVLGSHRAQWDYATSLRDGRNMPYDYLLAYNWMAIAVYQGYTADFKSTYCDKKKPAVSTFFEFLKGNAYGYVKDYDKAIECFDRVIADGIDEGKVVKAIAIVRRAGDNLSDDERRQCMDLLKDASETLASAKRVLAGIITLGKTEMSDEELDESVNLVVEAADAGDPEALNVLGSLYNSAGEEYYEQAAKCFETAYEMGMLDSESAEIFAKYLRDGLGGVKVDKAKAADVVKKALPKDYRDRLLKMLADTWIPTDAVEPPADDDVTPQETE